MPWGAVASSSGGGTARQQWRWASPRRLLALLCAINLLFFIDRGVISSNGVNGTAEEGSTDNPGISAEFGLSLFQDGLMGAIYYVGVMLGSPFFAQLSKGCNVQRLIGAGTAVFAASALLCGFSQSFGMVLVFRFLVGAGTGCLIALGPPLIDDHAPPASATLWLGVYFLCMPTGVALGFLFGGAVGSGMTWRAAFWIEAGAAAPFSLWCLLTPAVDIRRHAVHGVAVAAGAGAHAGAADAVNVAPFTASDGLEEKLEEVEGADGIRLQQPAGLDPQEDTTHSTKDAAAEVEAQPTEASCQLASGSTASSIGQLQAEGVPKTRRVTTAVAGGWRHAVAAVRDVVVDLRLLTRHSVCVCVILALTCWNGFLGAYGYYGPRAVRDLFAMDPETADFVFGAVLAGAGIAGSLAGGFLLDALGSSTQRGMLLCTGVMLAACLFAAVAVTIPHSTPVFWTLVAVAEVSLFVVQAPANAVLMWAVPAYLRPFALSMSEFLQHALGDIPTPPILGALQEAFDNWRLSLGVFCVLLLVGAAMFLLGAALARHARDYRQQEEEDHAGVPTSAGRELAYANSMDAPSTSTQEQQLLACSQLADGSSVAIASGTAIEMPQHQRHRRHRQADASAEVHSSIV